MMIVFLAEDNPGDILLIKEAFKEAGIPVDFIVKTNGELATLYVHELEKNYEVPPDMIILDLNLPFKNGFEILAGGTGNDTFLISGERYYILSGSAGDDSFRFSDGAVLNGTIAGGTGNDRLDFSAYTTVRNVKLISFTAAGYNGNQSAISQGFTGIDGITGSAVDGVNGDKLDGIENLAGQWTLNGNDSRYQAAGAAGSLNFRGFELLYGGIQDDLFTIIGNESGRIYGNPGHDTFIMMPGAMLAGSIDGGGGVNTLDYSAL
jgi:acrosin